MMTVIAQVNKCSVFVFSTFICTDVNHNHLFFLSCIGFFDQWLIGGLLDGCVAIWAGKTQVRYVHVDITVYGHFVPWSFRSKNKESSRSSLGLKNEPSKHMSGS